MNKFKRLLSLILVLTLTLTMLSGCGNEIAETVTSGDAEVTEVPEVTTEATTTTEVATTTAATTTEAATVATEATTEATTAATTASTSSSDYTVEAMSATMYATYSVNVRSGPSVDYDKVGVFDKGEEVTVTGRASTGWYQVDYNGTTAYVSSSYLSSEPVETSSSSSSSSSSGSGSSSSNSSSASSSSSSSGSSVTRNGYTIYIDGRERKNLSSSSSISFGSWSSDNGWDLMLSYMKESRYATVLDLIMEGIQNFEPVIYISGYITEDEASEFSNLILPMICVEYSYVSSITPYTSGGYLSKVAINYNVEYEDEGKKMVSEIREVTDNVLSNLKSSMSDYDKVRYLTEWLVLNCVYNGESSTCNTAYGAIVEGEANCQGYAKGLFYLLDSAGLDVIFCEGWGKDAKHLWVKVKIGSSWYNVDPTWCDPKTDTAIDPTYMDYGYLCVTDSFMEATHAEVYDMVFYTVPSATSTTYDWFILNGCYATSLSEAVSILKSETKSAVAQGTEYVYVRIKLSSASVYADVAASYKRTGYNNNILSSISSAYTCEAVQLIEGGYIRVYRLKKN